MEMSSKKVCQVGARVDYETYCRLNDYANKHSNGKVGAVVELAIREFLSFNKEVEEVYDRD